MQARSLQHTFYSAIKAHPVFIVTNMEHPDHIRTLLPFEVNSPLLRLALLATDLGATRLVFTPQERHGAVIYACQHGSMKTMQSVLLSNAHGIPAAGFRWCEINRGFFCDELVAWGEALSAWTNDGAEHLLGLPDPQPARYDANEPAHRECREQVLAYFQAQGWKYAVDGLSPPVTAKAAEAPSAA